jgi:hypothetical protein
MKSPWTIRLFLALSALVSSCSLAPRQEPQPTPSAADVLLHGATPSSCTRWNRAGVLEFHDGTELHASGFSFNPHYPPPREIDAAPTGYVVLNENTYQYWVRADWLLEYGFIRDADRLVLNCSTSTPCPAGRPAFSIGYSSGGSESSIQLDQVIGFTPDCPPLRPANEHSHETHPGALEVTWLDTIGETHTLAAASVRSMEYNYAGPGLTYVSYGAGWHEYETLRAVPSALDEPLDYLIGQLSSVEFPHRYESSREIVLTLVNGDRLNATLVPQGDRSEVEAEGLLLDFYSTELNTGILDVRYRGILVYIPFASVVSIHWEAVR